MCGILTLTIYLFVFEVVEVDVAAISIMVLLGLMSLIGPPLGLEHPLVSTKHLFDGFASNAVMSIIAVMIIGAGLDKTGVMNRVAGVILRYGGPKLYRTLRPFFLGLILGGFGSAGVWLVIDAFTGMHGNAFTLG